MPQSAQKLLDLLAQPEEARAFKALGAAGRLVPGTVLPEPAGVFPRYVAPDSEPPPEKPAPQPKKAPKGKA
jgi:methionyl-tRNA synthetase